MSTKEPKPVSKANFIKKIESLLDESEESCADEAMHLECKKSKEYTIFSKEEVCDEEDSMDDFIDDEDADEVRAPIEEDYGCEISWIQTLCCADHLVGEYTRIKADGTVTEIALFHKTKQIFPTKLSELSKYVSDSKVNKAVGIKRKLNQLDEPVAEMKARTNKVNELVVEKKVRAKKADEPVVEKKVRAKKVDESVVEKKVRTKKVDESVVEKKVRTKKVDESVVEKKVRAKKVDEPVVEKKVRAKKVDEPVVEKKVRAKKVDEPVVEKKVRAKKVDEPPAKKSKTSSFTTL